MPVIFRASGSKFRVTVRASAREIPRTTAKAPEPRKREARGLCCLPARRDRGISKRPLQPPQNRPTQTPHRFRLLPLSQPLTRFTAPRINPFELTRPAP